MLGFRVGRCCGTSAPRVMPFPALDKKKRRCSSSAHSAVFYELFSSSCP